jgi:hypothetical protein
MYNQLIRAICFAVFIIALAGNAIATDTPHTETPHTQPPLQLQLPSGTYYLVLFEGVLQRVLLDGTTEFSVLLATRLSPHSPYLGKKYSIPITDVYNFYFYLAHAPLPNGILFGKEKKGFLEQYLARKIQRIVIHDNHTNPALCGGIAFEYAIPKEEACITDDINTALFYSLVELVRRNHPILYIASTLVKELEAHIAELIPNPHAMPAQPKTPI